MREIKVDLNNIKKEEIQEIVDSFLRGETVAYPTDTVYGLGCISTNRKAIEKIYKIKKRKEALPFIILVKSFCMAKKYAKISKKQDNYLRNVWPSSISTEAVLKNAVNSPKTVILESRGIIPKNAVGKDNSLAFRLPNNDFLSKILKKVNLPIVSTSLNISKQKPLEDIVEIESYFKGLKPDLVVNGGKLKTRKISSIFDIRDINNIKKIR